MNACADRECTERYNSSIYGRVAEHVAREATMVRTAERKRGGVDDSEAPATTFADPGGAEMGTCCWMAVSFLSFCGFQG